MKHTLRQVFHSGKFVVGFCILMTTLFIVFVYPLVIKDPPLQIIGQGTFFPPGIYVSAYDTINPPTTYTLNLDNAAARRVANKLSMDDRAAMREWLMADGIPDSEIDIADAQKLLTQWQSNYDPSKQVEGMTLAKSRYYQRVNTSLQGLLSTEGAIIAAKTADTGALEQTGIVKQTDYVNVNQIANVRVLLLGTDNFGRDMTTELIRATGVSLLLVEQNAHKALQLAHRAYVLETGNIVMTGTGRELLASPRPRGRPGQASVSALAAAPSPLACRGRCRRWSPRYDRGRSPGRPQGRRGKRRLRGPRFPGPRLRVRIDNRSFPGDSTA